MGPRHSIPRILVAMAGLCLAPTIVRAQHTQTATQVAATEADVSRSEMMGTITQRIFAQDPDHAPPSPADEDLGEQRLLVPDDRYKPFTLFANASEFYTSNAYLSNGGAQSDWFTALQFGAAWVPHITGSLYGEISALQQLYRYATFNGLNFNSLDLGSGLIYPIRQLDDLAVFARYNFNLLTNDASNQTLFYQQTIRLGLQKPLLFSRAHSGTLGFLTDINLDGWPDYAVRNRFALLAGYQANLTRVLQANLFYQLAYFPFVETSRQDVNQILSGGLTLNFSPRFSIMTSVSASFNSSNEDYYNYSVLNTGAGVSANIKF